MRLGVVTIHISPPAPAPRRRRRSCSFLLLVRAAGIQQDRETIAYNNNIHHVAQCVFVARTDIPNHSAAVVMIRVLVVITAIAATTVTCAGQWKTRT